MCCSKRILIFNVDKYPLSIRLLVLTTLSTVPNNPSRTNLFTFSPSNVPVKPILCLQLCNLVIILVRDLALNWCASSPITQSLKSPTNCSTKDVVGTTIRTFDPLSTNHLTIAYIIKDLPDAVGDSNNLRFHLSAL